jgi:hypothetical protein
MLSKIKPKAAHTLNFGFVVQVLNINITEKFCDSLFFIPNETQVDLGEYNYTTFNFCQSEW